MRYLQIVLGVWLLILAVTEAQWFTGLCGGFLLYLGVANKGCPLIPGSSCATTQYTTKQNSVEDIAFEEVKVSNNKS